VTLVKTSKQKNFLKHQTCCCNNQGRADGSSDARGKRLIVYTPTKFWYWGMWKIQAFEMVWWLFITRLFITQQLRKRLLFSLYVKDYFWQKTSFEKFN